MVSNSLFEAVSNNDIQLKKLYLGGMIRTKRLNVLFSLKNLIKSKVDEPIDTMSKEEYELFKKDKLFSLLPVPTNICYLPRRIALKNRTLTRGALAIEELMSFLRRTTCYNM